MTISQTLKNSIFWKVKRFWAFPAPAEVILSGNLKKRDFWNSSTWLHTAGNIDIWSKMDCYTCFLSKRVILTALRCILKISKFWVWEIFAKNDKKCRKIRKITNFQFWISRPIWPILMICKLDKVSIRFFVTNPRYQTNKTRIRQKIAFFEVKCRFEAFSHKAKNPFFVEYSKGVEISTVRFSEKTYGACLHPQ